MNYIEHQRQKAQQYIEGVESGKIVANRWIKLAVKRYLKDLKRKDLVQDQAKVDRVFKFFSMLRVKRGKKYQQFEFELYQAFIIQCLFLFYYTDGRRRFTYFFLFVARKNGKTVFAVCLNLYFLIADKEVDPQVLLLASTREQASIALEYAKNIIRNSPALNKAVKSQKYKIVYNRGESSGFMKTLASKSNTLDGYNPHSAILDEVHSYPDDSLFNVIKSGIIERENPVVSLISTAGFVLDSLCNDLVETSKNILKGTVKDDSFLALLYTLDDKDDWNEEKNWVKANPTLGSLLKVEKLRIEYNQTQIRPSTKPNFKTKNLNIFVESSDAWIEEDIIAKVYRDVGIDLAGRKCYGGIDLSSTKDLTAFTLVFEIDEVFYQITFFFLPDNPEKKLRKGGVDLQLWIETGHIIESKTKTIDYDLIYQTIENCSKLYDIVSIAYDPFNSALLVPKIEDLGITCNAFKQTALHFNFPLKFLEKMIYEQRMILGINPVMRWNFRNVVLYVDGNGNIKIVKNKSLDSVDGVVSLAMAIGEWIAENLDAEKANIEAYLNM